MSLSCIIPTRNRSAMVKHAVASVMAQQEVDLEIIVVDDASTDDTGRLLRQEFPALTYLTLSVHSGPGRARNAGAEIASGDVLMFLDSDDQWLADHVQSLEKVLKSGYEVAYGTTLTCDKLTGREFLIPEAGRGAAGDCLKPLCRWCFMVPSSLAVSRAAFMDSGGFPGGRLGEDWPFLVKLAAQYPFGFAGPEPITIRQLHQDSLCCRQGKEVLLAAIRQVRRFLDTRPGITQTESRRLQMLEQWLAQENQGGRTVQECYLAMQEEGLL